MASVAQQRSVSGNIIRLKIDGKEVGRAQSIDARASFGQEGQYEIGSIMPVEHVALRYEGSVTVDKFRIRKSSLADLGLAKFGVGILKMGVINIEITDRYTNEIIEVYRGCSLNEYSRSHRANAISGENATWMYLSADSGTPET
jgi:hypothetical protein